MTAVQLSQVAGPLYPHGHSSLAIPSAPECSCSPIQDADVSAEPTSAREGGESDDDDGTDAYSICSFDSDTGMHLQGL